jgi:hypothetical protein
MTIIKPPDAPPPKTRHDVALWAATAAFFGSLLAVGVFDVLNPDQWLEYMSALIVALITGGAVYAKERLEDAKKERAASEEGKL